MEHVNNFSCYTHSEGRTGNGQFVNFTCRPEDVDQVKEFLKKIRTIDIPTTGRVAISHGGCGQYTRFDIKQHDYAGGGRGYIEVLEINNPPEGHCGIVINEYNHGDSIFIEWETLKNARDAFKRYMGSCDTIKDLMILEGFKRVVICNALTPWFYAIGDEEIIGDYTFPDGLQDDPVYRFGKKFIVDCDGVPEIKTCMGARFLTEDGSDGYGRPKKYHKRFIYWDDGSFFDDHGGNANPPRPLEEDELWITEAIRQFKKEILTGKKTEFSINFTDGNIFIGKIKLVNKHCAEGRYNLRVKIKGERGLMEGYVDFKPQKFKNIVQAVVENYKRTGKEAELVIVDSFRKINPKGKKWAGVYHSHS